MQKWLVTLGIVLVLLVGGLTVQRWLPWAGAALGVVEAESELIQSLASLLQLLFWAGAGLLAYLRLFGSGKPPDVEQENTSTGQRSDKNPEAGVNVGDVTGRDVSITQIIHPPPPTPAAPPPPDLPAEGQRYLAYLVEMYRYLGFEGMGVTDKVPLQLELLEMYVPLTARVGLPEGETATRDLHMTGRKATQEEREAIGERVSGPQPLLDLLTQHDGLVLLGDPGAGKTTFLRYLALRVALGEGAALGLRQRIPLLLPLARYAEALTGRDVPFKAFLVAYAEEESNEVVLGALLDDALKRGEALLLLDGLDEVRDEGVRRRVVERVRQFYARHRKAGNKFVLSSRIVGYPEVRPSAMAGLAECVLVDFEDEEIEAFVDQWTAALERAAHGAGRVATQAATRERAELLQAVHHNPGVRRLAANPLLLTILALMKRQGVALPERRVELYHTAVQTLVRNWNLLRSKQHTTRPVALETLETVRVLAPLALWMHESSPGVGLVPHAALHERLHAILVERGTAPEGAEGKARSFLEDVRQHTALLLDRGGRRYGFIHLTFQEFLAGVAIARLAQPNVEPVVQLLAAHVGDPLWREVSLLAIGYLGIIMQQEAAAGVVLSALQRRAPGEPGEALLLAAEAVLDTWPGGVTAACRDEVIAALLPAMRDPALPVARRAALGSVLGRLGDPRFDPDHWYLPREPLLGFVEIPAGPFLMGTDPAQDLQGREDEQPQHTLHLPTYWLARYPVTVAQWRAYLHATRREPRDPDSLRGAANHPVTSVYTEEALKYCVWLDGVLRRLAVQRLAQATLEPAQLALWEGLHRGSLRVMLPSEAEWEKGARGHDGRIYPWGNAKLTPERANYDQTRLGATNAVGCFPASFSPYGLEEMVGNVYELTRSAWEEQGYPYPSGGSEQATREDVTLHETTPRVLRGGSFAPYGWAARCAYRLWLPPLDRFFSCGFRVAVSPAPLASGSSEL